MTAAEWDAQESSSEAQFKESVAAGKLDTRSMREVILSQKCDMHTWYTEAVWGHICDMQTDKVSRKVGELATAELRRVKAALYDEIEELTGMTDDEYLDKYQRRVNG